MFLLWGISSVGRALLLQGRGHRIVADIFHVRAGEKTASMEDNMTEDELSELIRKEREEAFYEGVDHVLNQLRIINPYGYRNGFLDD